MEVKDLVSLLLVGTGGKIEAFMPLVDRAVSEGLATLEKVQIRLYSSGSS